MPPLPGEDGAAAAGVEERFVLEHADRRGDGVERPAVRRENGFTGLEDLVECGVARCLPLARHPVAGG